MPHDVDRRTGWGGEPVAAPTLDAFEHYESGSGIWLKPEVLQPVGSFKIRGVYNWAASLTDAERARGLSTTSAGNTAQALGYAARAFGVAARSLVPEWLPANKSASLERYGVELIRVPFDDLLDYMFEERWRSEPYSYLNPWGQPELIAGHGTASLEIVADLPDVDTVFVPIGGGGLVAGVGSALKALRATIRVVGVQAAANPALPAALAAGRSVWIDWKDTICEGASVPIIVDEMFPLLSTVVDEVVLVTEQEVKDAIRSLAVRNKLVAEGAGAAALAAASKTPAADRGRSVCIVSGGSIDAALLAEIVAG
jgi:threonine dehydratase